MAKPAKKPAAKSADKAAGPRVVGRPIKKGQVLNPLGAGAHNPLPKLFKRLSLAQLTDIGHLFFQGTHEQVRAKAEDPTTTMVELLVIQCMRRAVKEGNTASMNALFDRFVGKVRENMHVQHSGAIGGEAVVARVVVMLPDNGRSVRVEAQEPKKVEDAS